MGKDNGGSKYKVEANKVNPAINADILSRGYAQPKDNVDAIMFALLASDLKEKTAGKVSFDVKQKAFICSDENTAKFVASQIEKTTKAISELLEKNAKFSAIPAEDIRSAYDNAVGNIPGIANAQSRAGKADDKRFNIFEEAKEHIKEIIPAPRVIYNEKKNMFICADDQARDFVKKEMELTQKAIDKRNFFEPKDFRKYFKKEVIKHNKVSVTSVVQTEQARPAAISTVKMQAEQTKPAITASSIQPEKTQDRKVTDPSLYDNIPADYFQKQTPQKVTTKNASEQYAFSEGRGVAPEVYGIQNNKEVRKKKEVQTSQQLSTKAPGEPQARLVEGGVEFKLGKAKAVITKEEYDALFRQEQPQVQMPDQHVLRADQDNRRRQQDNLEKVTKGANIDVIMLIMKGAELCAKCNIKPTSKEFADIQNYLIKNFADIDTSDPKLLGEAQVKMSKFAKLVDDLNKDSSAAKTFIKNIQQPKDVVASLDQHIGQALPSKPIEKKEETFQKMMEGVHSNISSRKALISEMRTSDSLYEMQTALATMCKKAGKDRGVEMQKFFDDNFRNIDPNDQSQLLMAQVKMRNLVKLMAGLVVGDIPAKGMIGAMNLGDPIKILENEINPKIVNAPTIAQGDNKEKPIFKGLMDVLVADVVKRSGGRVKFDTKNMQFICPDEKSEAILKKQMEKLGKAIVKHSLDENPDFTKIVDKEVRSLSGKKEPEAGAHASKVMGPDQTPAGTTRNSSSQQR